ncbi:MAG TPA: tetratricopeptide repeat protein [Candidatus Acidoferrum sp.]|nr:tetratricopeptide repeat protein [Candidatus Acidoferrum sp.]
MIGRVLLLFLLVFPSVVSAQTSPQATFEELTQKAQKAYEADHLDEAAALYRDAVKIRSDSVQSWWALGMIEYQRDRYPECRDALDRMIAIDSSAAPGFALLGLCEYRTRQYDIAFQHLKKAHMLVPPTQPGGQLLDMADYHLALLLTQQGAFEVAQELLMRVARRVHTNPDMMFAAGLASLRMPVLPSDVAADQRDVVTMAGKTFWDLATRPPEEAEADFKALVAKYPKFSNVHYFYGTYLAARRPEDCVPEFLQELTVTPESVPARVQLALRYILDDNLDAALKSAREAVKLSPDSVGAQLALAKALKAKGDNPGSLTAYLAAERLDPVSPAIRLQIVNLYRALDRVDDMRREMADYERLKTQEANWP